VEILDSVNRPNSSLVDEVILGIEFAIPQVRFRTAILQSRMKKLNKVETRAIVAGVMVHGNCRSYDGGKTWQCNTSV
jgi:hypothetical protein